MEEKLKKENLPQPTQIINIPIQTFYANGMKVGLSLTDVVITFSLNGQPIQIMNLSYSTAKTLAENLNIVLNDLEQRTKTKVLSMKDVNDVLQLKS